MSIPLGSADAMREMGIDAAIRLEQEMIARLPFAGSRLKLSDRIRLPIS